MLTDSMAVRSDSAAVGKSERRTRKSLVSLKIGMIYTTPPVQTIMKIISTAMKGSWKSGNGKTGFMRIAWQKDVIVNRIVRAMSTDLS